MNKNKNAYVCRLKFADANSANQSNNTLVKSEFRKRSFDEISAEIPVEQTNNILQSNTEKANNELTESAELIIEFENSNLQTDLPASTASINVLRPKYSFMLLTYPSIFYEGTGINRIKYLSAYHYLVAKKALMYSNAPYFIEQNRVVYNKIIRIYNLNLERLERQIESSNEREWNEKLNDIIFNANLLKFLQNVELKKRLLETGIVNISYKHKYFILGLEFNKTVNNDQLGKILMHVRDHLDCRTTALQNISQNRPPTPYLYQQNIIDNIESFYAENKIGKICWACGLGKTLMAVFIAEKLRYKKILIGVPSLYLQDQFAGEILKIFPKKENILFVCRTTETKINTTMQQNDIGIFLGKLTTEPVFIISTYMSCSVLRSFTFDFKIGDEAHHLVDKTKPEYIRSYNDFHDIIAHRSLFITATEKIITDDQKVYSMDSEEKFGKYIDKKLLSWAVENKKITDYNLLIINTTSKISEKIPQKLINQDAEKLLNISYTCLLAFLQTFTLDHIIIYCNTINSAQIVSDYLQQLISLDIFNHINNNIYIELLHSIKLKYNYANIENILDKFKKAKFGILVCVKLLNEGFDFPELNGVCFAENVKSKNRIMQCATRPFRLNKNNPDKRAYIIIPCQNNFENIPDDIIYNLYSNDNNLPQKIICLNEQNHKLEIIQNPEINNKIQNISRY